MSGCPIPGVDTEALSKAKSSGSMDASSERLLEEEANYIKKRRKLSETAPLPTGDLSGLAISGGGIRSATFSLGVLQALAKHGWLAKIDYLSTVSGGGYIGAALTWLLNSRSGGDFGVDSQNFPYGTDDPAGEPDRKDSDKQQRLLKYLREHGNYLTPGDGIGWGSFIAIIVRGIGLNILVWAPILVAILALLLMANAFEVFFAFAVLLTTIFCCVCIAYSFITYRSRAGSNTARYNWRRTFESWARRVLWAIALLSLFASLPWVAEYFGGNAGISAGDAVGPSSVVAGLASGSWLFIRSASRVKSKIPLGLIASVGAALLIYGLILTSYSVADWLIAQGNESYWLAFSAFLILAVACGWFVNLNYISIHRYYRDRLMETYMPDVTRALAGATGAAHLADAARVADMCDENDPRGPYHIINTNAVLVDSTVRRIHIRGGDNFIISPKYCGGNATGWSPTREFMGNGMTLATAVAISGAAANPNTGVGGVGLTRNPLISLLMSLLNLRLGYWARNIGAPPAHPPNHFDPGLYEIGSVMGVEGYKETRPVIQLSDGGHFENLALYELIRRRLKLIIVVDAGADPDFTFADLQIALRRVREDFGARVDFADHNRPSLIMPNKAAGYPKDTKRAKQGHIVANISYADGSQGTLIFMKTTLVPGVSMEVKGYRGANPDFPDQSTADQFFDGEQFEAYRELGFRIASNMIAAVGNPFSGSEVARKKTKRRSRAASSR